ncbi:LysR family transcriptional regulator [Umezawaea sp. Da 62-37]|uniref:LysR family transcriptional regulator n=1 Tax=Umezawaea sp. Da 62-37 TaxID=3075927 RepID=UPI0028F745E4|nr:LysR family transcriptional regulator [Umezawaea sp. Da 62-37]WNV86502.1 LysR family transcriptional regulator [Umezawaea sp. Da 62-37]
MESRPLRYFVAVAEELNFTRAAEKLGIASPPLSRAIRKLEAELGVTLFERTTHSVSLTPAGAVLLDQARIALEALEAAGRRARRAADPDPKTVLAVKADNASGILETILAAYASDPAAEPVAIRLCGWQEHPRLLREGHADVALLYEPFDHTGLDSETISSEPRVLALASAHPLARRAHVTLADLDLPGLDPANPGDLDRCLAHVSRRSKARDLPELLAHVEFNDLMTLLPASIAARYPRPGVTYVPVLDAPRATLVIAWPQQSRSLATAALVRTATAVVAG